MPAFKLIFIQSILVYFQFGQTLKQAFFQRQKAQYLPENVIKTKFAKTELECSLYCTRLEGCLSVNFKISGLGRGLCELNNNTISEKGGVEELNFVYLQIAPWSLETKQSPKQSANIESKMSCKEWLNEDSSLENGVYNLKGSSEIYKVYCHMTEIRECGPGGWTMVMKINGDQTTFNYESNLWTNKESYAVEDGLEGLTEKESKLASYWNTPFKKICLGMTVNGDRKWMVLDYEASSLYSLIADGQYRNTSAGRAGWKSLIAGSSLQPYCNQEGFGIFYEGQVRIRLGYLANNQNKCGQSDSCIGFGISYNACYIRPNTTCGNIAQCSHTDNGQKLTEAFGYILVQ